MQRALTATETAEPPLKKPQASPSKVSTSAAAAIKDVSQKEDGTTQKAEVPGKNLKDSPAPAAQQKKEDINTPLQKDITQASTTASPPVTGAPSPVPDPTEGEKTDINVPTVPSTKDMVATVSHPSTSRPAQAPRVGPDIEASLHKEKDFTSTSPPTVIEKAQQKEEKSELVLKSTDQLIDSSAEAQPQQTLNKNSTLDERPAMFTPPAANQESGGFFGFGSPKSQRAASITSEAMTGKMLGFGSSLFNSASTLITSAVHDESRTTPPSSRKMSAPAQVSASPKSSPPVSPRLTSAKEVKTVPKPDVEKTQEPGLTKVDKGPSEPTKPMALQTGTREGQSTCPLCKVELNMGFKDSSNYNTCTGCNTTVCNKCGFSPMPNVTEVHTQGLHFG